MFRPFFIRLDLPYSVKRGEKLALQVLVFNYMESEQDVKFNCLFKIFTVNLGYGYTEALA